MTDLIEMFGVKFHEYSANGKQVVLWRQKCGNTDMKDLIVTFSNVPQMLLQVELNYTAGKLKKGLRPLMWNID